MNTQQTSKNIFMDYQRLTLTVLYILGGGGGYFFQQKASYPIVVFVLSLFSRKKSLKGFNFSLTDEMLCMNLWRHNRYHDFSRRKSLIRKTFSARWEVEYKISIWDALRDLVPFVQFTKRDKQTRRSFYFSKVPGWSKSNIPPWVLFTLFKFYKWYQIAQSAHIIK